MAFKIEQKGENEFELTGLDAENENCWLTIGKASVCLHKSDEGLVIDVYRLNQEDGESIAGTYVFDSELAEDEEPQCACGAAHEPITFKENPADNSDRDETQPIDFTESPAGERAKEKWAEAYDELNGAPENDGDR